MSYGETTEPDYDENEAAYDDARTAIRKPQRDGRHTVEEYLDQLDREVMILADVVDRAEALLGPAMRPEEPAPPVDPAGKLAAIRNQSALGDRVEGAAARVRVRAGKLAGLLDRLDL